MLAINAYTQNLGVDPFEPLSIDLVRRDLARSYRSPGQGEEDQSDIFPAQIIAQPYSLFQVTFQSKIWRHLTNFESHSLCSPHLSDLVLFEIGARIITRKSGLPSQQLHDSFHHGLADLGFAHQWQRFTASIRVEQSHLVGIYCKTSICSADIVSDNQIQLFGD
jgi:hypothetical protein